MHTHSDPLKKTSVEIHAIVISGAAFDPKFFLQPLAPEMQVRSLVVEYSSIYFDPILSKMVYRVWHVHNVSLDRSMYKY